jgi:hypothetical protein
MWIQAMKASLNIVEHHLTSMLNFFRMSACSSFFSWSSAAFAPAQHNTNHPPLTTKRKYSVNVKAKMHARVA